MIGRIPLLPPVAFYFYFHFCATFYESHKEQSMPNKSFTHNLQDLDPPPTAKRKSNMANLLLFTYTHLLLCFLSLQFKLQ